VGFNIGDLASRAVNLVTGGVVDKAMAMVDKLIPDKNQAMLLKSQLETLRATQEHESDMAEVQLMLGQIAVNTEEAKSPSLFVAGARPAIMWICGFGIGWAFVLKPMVEWAYFLYTKAPLVGAPILDSGDLMALVTALLGLGGMRSFDKKQGTARDSLK
jgi:hypothetical protein